MDFSLTTALICLNFCVCIAEMYMKGSGSQNVDLGLSFCFTLCRRRNFEKKYNES